MSDILARLIDVSHVFSLQLPASLECKVEVTTAQSRLAPARYSVCRSRLVRRILDNQKLPTHFKLQLRKTSDEQRQQVLVVDLVRDQRDCLWRMVTVSFSAKTRLDGAY